VNAATVIRASAIVGFEDLRAIYTWRTWTLGWLLRVVVQVTFFALLGRYIGQPDRVEFLLVGAAASVAALEALTVVMYVAADRWAGLLPLIVASPGDYHLVLLARNVNCVATGTATSGIALLVSPWFVAAPLPFGRLLLCLPLLALGALSTYCFGGFLCAVVAKVSNGRWLVLNLSYMALSVFGGFLVPLDFWPAPVQWLAELLPFSHALAAMRGLLDGASAGFVLGRCAAEALVLVGWLAVGRLALAASIALARRDGSIELSDA
jgi:ABC-2 type transport system permease protein